MNHLQRALCEDGWTLVPQCVSAGAIGPLREACAALWAGGDSSEYEIPAGAIWRDRRVARVPFEPAAVSALKALLGDGYTTYPNVTVRVNRYTDWHVDGMYRKPPHGCVDGAGPGEPPSHVQCVVYLQDNDSVKGGGLDVVPGSHRWTIRTGNSRTERRGVPTCVSSRAGDLLIFDGRLLHRGTPNGQERADDSDKVGVFWTASLSMHGAVQPVLHYLFGRDRYVRTTDLGLTANQIKMFSERYRDLSSVIYPSNFDSELVDVVESAGLRIATVKDTLAGI